MSAMAKSPKPPPAASTPMTPRPGRKSSQEPSYGCESNGMRKLVPPNNSQSPPCKKPRQGDTKPDVDMPLWIGTDRARSCPANNPQQEATSPTLPSDPLRDESQQLHSTKEKLLQQIVCLDREIVKTETRITKLKRKKVEMEGAASQPARDLGEPVPAPGSMNRSLPHIICVKNRNKAQKTHQILIKYFKNKQKEKEKRETYLTTTYAKLSADWARRLEQIDNDAKKKEEDARAREIFEEVFPELKEQREDKERLSMMIDSSTKSDADLKEIKDGLDEQELEDKKMRSYAVVPPIMLDEKSRKYRFNNRNGLIEDPMQEYKDKQLINLWTAQEKDMFKEKYIQHPKNFSKIKSYLERKSVADCVQYYYLSKKAQNYPQPRKNRARARSTRNQQNKATNNSASSVGIRGVPTIKGKTCGVTTRAQKKQAEIEQQQSSAAAAATSTSSSSTSEGIN